MFPHGVSKQVTSRLHFHVLTIRSNWFHIQIIVQSLLNFHERSPEAEFPALLGYTVCSLPLSTWRAFPVRAQLFEAAMALFRSFSGCKDSFQNMMEVSW